MGASQTGHGLVAGSFGSQEEHRFRRAARDLSTAVQPRGKQSLPKREFRVLAPYREVSAIQTGGSSAQTRPKAR